MRSFTICSSSFQSWFFLKLPSLQCHGWKDLKRKCLSRYFPFLPWHPAQTLKAMMSVCIIVSNNIQMTNVVKLLMNLLRLLEMPRTGQCYWILNQAFSYVLLGQTVEILKGLAKPSIHSQLKAVSLPSILMEKEAGAKPFPLVPLLPFAVRAGRTRSRDMLHPIKGCSSKQPLQQHQGLSCSQVQQLTNSWAVSGWAVQEAAAEVTNVVSTIVCQQNSPLQALTTLQVLLIKSPALPALKCKSKRTGEHKPCVRKPGNLLVVYLHS